MNNLPMRTPTARLAIPTLTLLLVGSSCCTAAEFIPLGYGISTNLFGHKKASVSEDGRVVALWSLDDELVRWTSATGSEVILNEVSGASVSGDGSTIVTSRILAREPNRLSRGVKVIGDRVEDLPLPVGESYSTAERISQDGSTIVGDVFQPNFGGSLLRWTDEGAEELPLRWSAVAVSQDGTVVVDTFNRWTAETGAVELPDFQGTDVFAFGASSNGRWTVGRSATLGAFDRRGVRYDGVSEPEAIVPFDQDWGAAALDITNDGSLIVGRLYDPSFGGSTDPNWIVAGIWTEQLGEMVPLQGLLEEDPDLQVALEGWHLTGVSDVTDDGRYMVGHAYNPDGLDEAFLLDVGALVPEPSSLVIAAIGALLLVLIGRDGKGDIANFAGKR